MAASKSITEPPARCWIWMRGGLGEQSYWKSGWYGAPSVLGGISMENPNYRPCRVPEDAQWMLFPVDPR